MLFSGGGALLLVGFGSGPLIILDISPISRSSISIISVMRASRSGVVSSCLSSFDVELDAWLSGIYGNTDDTAVDTSLVWFLWESVCIGCDVVMTVDEVLKGYIESHSALNLIGTSSLIL